MLASERREEAPLDPEGPGLFLELQQSMLEAGPASTRGLRLPCPWRLLAAAGCLGLLLLAACAMLPQAPVQLPAAPAPPPAAPVPPPPATLPLPAPAPALDLRPLEAALGSLARAVRQMGAAQPAEVGSYVRRCPFGGVDRKHCEPAACAEGHRDLGVDCVPFTCTRTCLLAASKALPELEPELEGVVCAGEDAGVGDGPMALPQLFGQSQNWTLSSSMLASVELWGAGGGGQGPWMLNDNGLDAWVCGGGGVGGAHVRALLELKAGRQYRVEVGRAGAGATRGTGGHGTASRLLEARPGGSWKVLAEAPGGFGAGPSGGRDGRSQGGKGGVPGSAYLEAHVGGDGEASQERLPTAPILAPQALIRVWRPWTASKSPGLSVGPGRQPCGDVARDQQPSKWRTGCTHDSPRDFFLTCSKAFLGGVNGSHCHGVACVLPFGSTSPCLLHSDARHTARFTQALPVPLGPSGGRAWATERQAQQGFGNGGAGACPVLRQLKAPVPVPPMTIPTVATPLGPPEPASGGSGGAGLVVVHQCKRMGAYTLALQRCSAAAAWTLHGLWPTGVRACTEEPLQPAQIAPLQAELQAGWPDCKGGPGERFWAHEWLQHGSCTGLGQLQYFQRALGLAGRFAGECQGEQRECRLCLDKDLGLCGPPASPRG